MIIDSDVHISPTLEEGNSMYLEELFNHMEKAGVDKALTWLQPPYLRCIDDSLRYVYNATKSYPDKVLGFGWVDPHLGMAKSKDTIKKCIYEYGFYGVKLNGAQNSFYIDDPVISLPLIKEIAQAGKILALHVGADAFEYTHPYRVGKIASIFPELKILAVHMGGVVLPNLCNSMIEIATKFPNITLIGSKVDSFSILKAIKTIGSSRVCFGSDTPFELMHVEVARYKALLSDISSEDQQKIMGGNIKKLLNLGN